MAVASGGKEPENVLKDLLSVQVEVTERLLDAEEQKLRFLKAEIEVAKHKGGAISKSKELDMQEETLIRIRTQHQRLSQELQAMGLKQRRIKIARSLPVIGMKQTAKRRPSLFDHVVPKEELVSAKMEVIDELLTKEEAVMLPEIKAGLFSPKELAKELEYKDGVLIAGSLEGLIQLLIPTESYEPEKTFVFAFLLCSRLFIAPYQLLARVLKIFQYMHESLKSASTKTTNIGSRFAQSIREWTEQFPYDFRDEKMMRGLKEATQLCSTIAPELKRDIGQIQSTLIQKLAVLDQYEHVLSQINSVATQRLMNPSTQINIMRIAEDPCAVAQQLTHIELERLNNIGPEEFMQTFVKNSYNAREVKKTSNIEAYVEWFNRLSYLVATEICVSDRVRNRVKLMDFFVDLAIECKKLNNYNSFMAISAGLYMSPVIRLKKLRAKLNAKKIEELEQLLNPSGNFSEYRLAVDKSISAAKLEKERHCVVPFFSLLIKDLYFLNENMTDLMPNGNIRFEKCMAMARLVSQKLIWKDTVLPYERKKNILNYLMTVPIHTDDELLLVSYEIEPPETPVEKQKYHELKGQLGSYARCIGKKNGSITVAAASTLAAYPMYKGKN